MTEPVAVEAAQLFEFLAGPGLKTVLVSLHPSHTFSEPLSRQLTADHDTIALGTVALSDLVTEGGSALRFLHQGLRACGAPASFGVLPGYYLFRDSEMLAWDAGLPAFADLQAIARSALVGALWSGVMRDSSFVGQALNLGAQQVASQRIAARFRAAASQPRASGQRAESSTRPPVDDLYWAYQTLGVVPTATDREVHEAWRRKRMENHPDHAQDPVEFQRRSRISADINRARDIINSARSGRTHGPAYATA